MTQQTTVERIETILRRDLDVDVIVSRGGDPHYNEPDIVGVNVAAQTIAAEIDALTRERDEAREQHKHCGLFLDSANAELRECQSALRLALAGTEQKYFASPARIDDVRAALADAQAQLAEARAEVERLTREVDRVIDERESVTTIGLAMQERAQVAEAEVERLRPAAEAWRTYEALTSDENEIDPGDVLWNAHWEAAARARAAKESQP